MSFTLVCDTEIVTRLNEKFVNAHNYFKSNSSFGLDGTEIQPGYSESPIDLTAKIYQIIEYGHSKQQDLEFISGYFVDNYSIGGDTQISLTPIPEIISALDTVLYSFSNCIDDKE